MWCNYFLYYNPGWASTQRPDTDLKIGLKLHNLPGQQYLWAEGIFNVSGFHWSFLGFQQFLWRRKVFSFPFPSAREAFTYSSLTCGFWLWTSHSPEFLQLANGAAAPYGNKQLAQQFRRWIVKVNRVNHVSYNNYSKSWGCGWATAPATVCSVCMLHKSVWLTGLHGEQIRLENIHILAVYLHTS